MKVVILAGGFGTRLSEYTNLVPKPMVKLNNKPIIYYIMKHFSNYGFDDFYIALGYKGNVIRDYFKKNSFNKPCCNGHIAYGNYWKFWNNNARHHAIFSTNWKLV